MLLSLFVLRKNELGELTWGTEVGNIDSEPQAPSRDVGYLVVGHGTRSRSGQEQVRAVFAQMTQLTGPCSLRGQPAELAFLELAEPDIPTAVERLYQSGVRQLVVVPILIFSAGHAQKDIPDAVESAASPFGMRILRQCSSLCLDPTIVALSAERFHRALACTAESSQLLDSHILNSQKDCTPLQGPPVSAMTNLVAEGVALALIGRGSSSDAATAAMLQFAELRTRVTPVSWSSVGFIHAQRPSVDEALDGLSATGLPWLVVQPHLLFEGELMNDLRTEVAYRQSFSPSQKWIITETLGASVQSGDTRLAAALCQLALRRPSPNELAADIGSDAACSRCQQAGNWCRVPRPALTPSSR